MASLIRALIAAVDNAEAVDASEAGGATKVQRRRLSDDDVLNIVLSESAELRHAATEFERRGDPEEARRLRSLAEVADRYAGRFEEHG